MFSERNQETSPNQPKFSKDHLVLNGNGIELRRNQDQNWGVSNTSKRYENKCFVRIIGRSGQSIILGPCLLDSLLKQPFTGHEIRPDAVKFTFNEDQWRLDQLYEFKSYGGKGHRVERKLLGFSHLLSCFRENPTYLPFLLAQALGNVISVPSTIIIPSDEGITVTFVYPSKRRVRLDFVPLETPFKLKFMRVPKQSFWKIDTT